MSQCAIGAMLFFFFSSRRRHTRCYRDWSSDVCSSDLQGPRPDMPGRPDGAPDTWIGTAHVLTCIQPSAAQIGRVRACPREGLVRTAGGGVLVHEIRVRAS